MEAKLRSILRRIHWFLVLKAAVAGLVWLSFPWWVFAVFALALYLVPLFEPFGLALPFALTLYAAHVLPQSVWGALLVALLMFYVLGIKDLILVRRDVAYETMLFVLLPVFSVRFFWDVKTTADLGVWWHLFALSAAYFLLLRGFEKHLGTVQVAEGRLQKLERARVAWYVATLVMLQTAIGALFLPLTYVLQAALVALSSSFVVELILDYLHGKTQPRRILAQVSVFALMLATVFYFGHWTLL